jgi:hypothetical protein
MRPQGRRRFRNQGKSGNTLVERTDVVVAKAGGGRKSGRCIRGLTDRLVRLDWK